MNMTPCPNFNHRRTDPPVGFCPDCGQVVNDNIAAHQCSKQTHASKRMNRQKYCVDCGKQLVD